MAREVRLYNPTVPIKLAERWINNRYLRLCERFMWSFKLEQGQFKVPDEYSTGTVTMTDGATTIVGVGTTFTSGMVGRQFKVNNYVYTIATFSSTTAITIDQAWENATEAGLSFSIVQAYITPSESDFQSFYTVVDPVDSRPIRIALSKRYLDSLDPERSTSSSPRTLYTQIYNSSNVPRYELWPHATAQRNYPYIYEKRVARLTASQSPPGIIRSDVLVSGALADLSRWPGTATQPNLMADANRLNWRMFEQEYKVLSDELIREDQNIYLNNFMRKHKISSSPVPMDADYFRNHAV